MLDCREKTMLVRIKRAAMELGTTVHNLRHWDESGRLVADRREPNGYRLYDLERIRSLKETLTGPDQTPPVDHRHSEVAGLIEQAIGLLKKAHGLID